MELLQRLTIVFARCIVLDQFYIIKSISPDILKLLNYKIEDLENRPVSILSQDDDMLEEQLHKKLTTGFFHDYKTTLRKANGESTRVNISGFHSHLINTADYIIIELECIEHDNIIEEKLRENSKQLETLLHCAWHDLRGPIVTIKGIVNLANVRKDETEVNTFFGWIGEYIENLDNHLVSLLNQINALNQKSPK